MPSTISYDPMSRTYKLMFLQNQLAHARNKQKVHSVGISNIIPYKGRPTSTINKSSSMRHSTSSLKGSDKNSTLNSMGASFCFIDQHRLIHHNAELEKKLFREQQKENERISQRLVNASCAVVTGHKAEIEYWEQRYYRSIALRYDEKGRRKEMVVLGSSRGVGANILGLGKGMEMKKIKSDRKNEEDENNKDIEKKHRRRVIKLTK